LNWLAHVFLSPPNPAWQLGNLLADHIPRAALAGLPQAVQHGVAHHHAIDRFTDAHALVKRAHRALPAHLQRYGGPALDIYYDYLLASSWPRYCAEPLADFTRAFGRDAQALAHTLPAPAHEVWTRIHAHDALAAYARIDAVEFALSRIAQRWQTRFGRTVPLLDCVPALEAQRATLETEFHEFFADLRAHAAMVSANLAAASG
jgi:acyl carrier protein phosphodiesterase